MLAVGGDHDVVLGSSAAMHPDGDRLLADAEVQEAADRRGAVQLDAALLEAADADHLRAAGRGVRAVGARVSSRLLQRGQVALGQAELAGLAAAGA